MADDTTQVVGTIPDTKAYSKTRRDERFILIEQRNLEINSQDEYIVLDELEAGSLQSVKVTTDNPYVQVLLQIDEYRNKDPNGQCAAEIIYNGNSDNTNRSFKVLDGQSSSKGYTMEYKPDQPEEYNKRIRLVIRNSIKPSTTVFGMGLDYTSAGNLPTPAVPAHMAGGTFSHPSFKSLTLGQIARAMTKPVGVSGYGSNSVFNESAIMNDAIELGSDHPYEGIAGKPTFTRDVSAEAICEAGANFNLLNNFEELISLNSLIQYRLRVLDEPEQFPGSSSTPSQMTVEIAPQASILGHSTTNNLAVGFGVVPWYGLETVRKSDLMAAGPFGDTWPGTSTYTPFTGTGADAGAPDGFEATEKSLTGEVLPAADSIIGKRMFIRRGGTIYFPGVVASVTKSLPPICNSVMSDNVDATKGYGKFLDPNHANKFQTEDTYFGVGVYPVGTASSGGAVSDNGIIVMPHFTGYENAALDGVVVGGATPITLDQTTIEVACDTNGNTTIDNFGGTGASPAGLGIEVGMLVAGDGIAADRRVVTVNPTDIVLSGTAVGSTTANRKFYHDRLLFPRAAVGGTGTYEVFHVPHTPWVYTFTFEPGVTESPIDFGVLFENEADNHYLDGPTYLGAFGTVNESTGRFANASNSQETGVTNSRGLYPASESNCWGIVTSQGDKNPKVLIKSVEVKRNKRVSYEG